MSSFNNKANHVFSKSNTLIMVDYVLTTVLYISSGFESTIYIEQIMKQLSRHNIQLKTIWGFEWKK